MQEASIEEINQYHKKTGFTFLYLYTPLCGTCQIAGRILTVVEQLFSMEEWRKINLNFIPHFAREWSIESVPCLLVLKNGKVYDKIYAFHSVPFVFDKINNILNS